MTLAPIAFALLSALPIALVISDTVWPKDIPVPTEEEKQIDEACDRHW